MNTQSPQGGAPRSAAESPPPGADPGDGASASKAFSDAATRIAEIREYVFYYLAVQADAVKLIVRKTAFYAVLGVIGLVAAGSAVVVAVVLLMTGIAHGLGALLHNQFWLGDLIVGIGLLGALALCAWMGISRMTGASRRTTVQKYESRKHQQRVQFGHDVKQRAENP